MANASFDQGTGETNPTCPCCGQTLGGEKRLRRPTGLEWILFLGSMALLLWTLQKYF
jgi:hypothetical protein